MSYVGNTPTTQAFSPAIDYFSGNGSTVAFTLSRPVASVAQVQVTVNNVTQNPSTAFTVSGQTLTFTGTPSSGTNNIYVQYTSPITQVIQPGQGTVGATQLVAGAVGNTQLAAGAALANIGTGGVTSTYLASGAARSNWGAGGVLQVLSTTKTDSFSSSSAPFVDITGLSVAITPSSTSSKILVMATVAVGNSSNNAQLNLVRNGTNISQSTSGTANNTVAMDFPSSYKLITYPIMYLDSPATTSAVTYKIQLGPNGATAYINVRGTDQYFGSTSTITVMEIAA